MCAHTGQALQVGEHYVATLVERAADGKVHLYRQDFSNASWDAGARPAAPAQMIGHWRATVTPAGEKIKPVLDDQAMLDLLEQLEPVDARREGMRYVLALMLVRRKLLIAEPMRGETMVLRRRGEAAEIAARIEVKDPGLDEATLTELISELEVLSGGGGSSSDLPVDAPATTPPAAVTPITPAGAPA